ncbi:hypothetical protein KR084_011374 [Drosophila pseudotakahashii]|nr:hypothetical protein KR084_011374 [Drosophila pseudotakahashii]
MERCVISLEENENSLRTIRAIKSLDKIYKTYLPQTLDDKLKKAPVSILKHNKPDNSDVKNGQMAIGQLHDRQDSTDSTTTLRNCHDIEAKSQAPSDNLYVTTTTTSRNLPQEDVTNIFEATGMSKHPVFREHQDLRKPHARISSGQMGKRSVNSSSSESSATGSAPVCGNPMNYVTFAEPEIRNRSFFDQGPSNTANMCCCEFSSPPSPPLKKSQMQFSPDLNVDYCCCSQNSIQLEQASNQSDLEDGTILSNCSCVGEQEIMDEYPYSADSYEKIAKDSKDYEQRSLKSQESEDRGLKMPDPEILKPRTENVSTSRVFDVASESSSSARSARSSFERLRSPYVSSGAACCAPPPSEASFPSPDQVQDSVYSQSNCLDIDSFLRAQHQRPPPIPSCDCCYVNDMLEGQSVYMTDYRPILSVGNQFNQFPEPGYGPEPFHADCCCQAMPLSGGFEATYPCSSNPFSNYTNPWDSQCLPSTGCPLSSNSCCYSPGTEFSEGLCNDMGVGFSTGIYGIGGNCSTDSQCCFLSYLSPGYCCSFPFGARTNGS